MDTGSVEVIQGTPVAWRGEKQRTWRQQDVSWQEGAGAAGPGVKWEDIPGRWQCGLWVLIWVGLCLPER